MGKRWAHRSWVRPIPVVAVMVAVVVIVCVLFLVISCDAIVTLLRAGLRIQRHCMWTCLMYV